MFTQTDNNILVLTFGAVDKICIY